MPYMLLKELPHYACQHIARALHLSFSAIINGCEQTLLKRELLCNPNKERA